MLGWGKRGTGQLAGKIRGTRGMGVGTKGGKRVSQGGGNLITENVATLQYCRKCCNIAIEISQVYKSQPLGIEARTYN